MFGGLASDGDRCAELWVGAIASHVDEDAVGCVASNLWCSTRSRCLDVVTVEATFCVNGSDNTFGGDGLTLEWGSETGSLDLCDGDCFPRVYWSFWLAWVNRSGSSRGRWSWSSSLEVYGVVIRVNANFFALNRQFVAGLRCSSCSFKHGRATESDKVSG